MPFIEIQYLKGDTPIHRLHPFVKLVFVMVITIVAALFTHPLALVALCVGILLVARTARIPRRKFRYMWVVVWVGVFLVTIQGVWFTSFGAMGRAAFESHTIFYLWPAWAPGGPSAPFSAEGALFGLSLGLRFAAIALAFPIFVITTHPSDLITALAEIRIGPRRIPYNLIFAFATAFRLVPTVSDQFDRTYDAQRSRGVELENKNPVKGIMATVPLFVPVLTAAMLRAQDLTLALETRAFGAQGSRTFLHELSWHTMDTLVTLLLVAALVVSWVLTNRYGVGILPFAPQ
jgi:energy-coupling factor transport system permease protein